MDKKHVNVHITDHKGNIVDKSTIYLKEEDTLVVQLPRETSIENVRKLHEHVKKALTENAGPLILSNDIELKVIKKV